MRFGGPASWACDTPSRRNYDLFRSEQPSAREWPSSSYIRNAFDNDWQAGLAAIGHEPAVDITSRQLTAAPKPYSRDEILAALRIWIAEVDEEHGPEARLLQAQYEAWVRARRSDDDRSITRFPRANTLHRFIGDWREVLAALGCAHRHYQARVPSPKMTPDDSTAPDELTAGLDLETAPPDLPRKVRCVGTSSNVTRAHAEATITWLRWLGQQLPEEQRASLRMEDFDRYMSSVRRLSLAQGKPLRPPSHASIERSPEIDGWLHAKHLAGLLRGKTPVRHSSKAFTERELVDAVTEAIRDLGPDMNRAQYTRWKGAQDRRLPSASTLRRHFSNTGSWSVALDRSSSRRRTRDPSIPSLQGWASTLTRGRRHSVGETAKSLPTQRPDSELPRNVSEFVTSLGELLKRPGACPDAAKRDLLRLLGHASPPTRRRIVDSGAWAC